MFFSKNNHVWWLSQNNIICCQNSHNNFILSAFFQVFDFVFFVTTCMSDVSDTAYKSQIETLESVRIHWEREMEAACQVNHYHGYPMLYGLTMFSAGNYHQNADTALLATSLWSPIQASFEGDWLNWKN